ncbi:unnamed protein product, partial [Pylaiella littoralis]
ETRQVRVDGAASDTDHEFYNIALPRPTAVDNHDASPHPSLAFHMAQLHLRDPTRTTNTPSPTPALPHPASPVAPTADEWHALRTLIRLVQPPPAVVPTTVAPPPPPSIVENRPPLLRRCRNRPATLPPLLPLHHLRPTLLLFPLHRQHQRPLHRRPPPLPAMALTTLGTTPPATPPRHRQRLFMMTLPLYTKHC